MCHLIQVRFYLLSKKSHRHKKARLESVSSEPTFSQQEDSKLWYSVVFILMYESVTDKTISTGEREGTRHVGQKCPPLPSLVIKRIRTSYHFIIHPIANIVWSHRLKLFIVKTTKLQLLWRQLNFPCKAFYIYSVTGILLSRLIYTLYYPLPFFYFNSALLPGNCEQSCVPKTPYRSCDGIWRSTLSVIGWYDYIEMQLGGAMVSLK